MKTIPLALFLAVLLFACSVSEEGIKASNFEGTLGSCQAATGFFLDDDKTKEALSCTEHTYVARGTSNPAPSLASSLAKGCQDEGGTWSTTPCQGFALACNTQVSNLQARTANVTLTRKTAWKPKGSFSLNETDDRKALCP